MRAEIYTPGYARSALRFMRRRTLASHGAFARTLFRPGTKVLDLGCGPGTITLDIARRLGPDGELFAVDRNAKQFKEAAGLANISVSNPLLDAGLAPRRLAKQRKWANVLCWINQMC